MVNAARSDPRIFNSHAMRGTSDLYVHCADTIVTFFSVGTLSTVYFVEDGYNTVPESSPLRGVDIGALAGDWHRTVAFFGQVFRKTRGISSPLSDVMSY